MGILEAMKGKDTGVLNVLKDKKVGVLEQDMDM